MISIAKVATEIADLSTDDLAAWIDAGWVKPSPRDGGYEFADVDVARCRFIVELRREFAIDDEAMPVVLSLLDQVYGLRHRLRLLLAALDRQPAEARQEIARAIRDLQEKEGDT